MKRKHELTNIHPSSVVEDGAILGDDVEIGPFCHVGPKVTLGDGTRLLSHAVVAGETTVGPRGRIFPFASVGHEPQDLKFQGEHSTLTIGSDCTIREGVTLNPGTAAGDGVTKIGDKCTFLANSHVAHDCIIGDNVVFSNNVMLAGHCVVGDYAIFGGGAGVHQFCRIGRHAFLSGLAGVLDDVIPFGIVQGAKAHLIGLNLIGMKRSGIPRESINAVRAAYKTMFNKGKPLSENLEELQANATDSMVLEIVKFVAEGGDRPLCTPMPGVAAQA